MRLHGILTDVLTGDYSCPLVILNVLSLWIINSDCKLSLLFKRPGEGCMLVLEKQSWKQKESIVSTHKEGKGKNLI